MITTVLAECPECQQEREAKIVDCDHCYEGFIQAGGDPDKYTDLLCEHIECLTCDTRIF